jgi:heme-degrading monooxygenase HmoA
MIVMIFEFMVDRDHYDEYMSEAAGLRPLLASVEGFISIERFESTLTPGKFVSIGYFENEDAVRAWRNLPEHRRVQELGRARLFTSYRLCMASVVRDYSQSNRNEAPDDSKLAHDSKEG